MDKVDRAFALRMGAAMAACGMVVGAAMLFVFQGLITARVAPAPFLLAAGFGAGVAGVVTHALFGRHGWKGWALALAGAVLATGLGAWIAAFLVVPRQYDLGFLAVLLSIGTPVLPLWVGAMALLHRHAINLRRNG